MSQQDIAKIHEFLNLIIASTEQIDVSATIEIKNKNKFIVCECEELKVELNRPNDIQHYLSSKIRHFQILQNEMEAASNNPSNELRLKLFKHKISLVILLMLREKISPTSPHEYPLDKLFARINGKRFKFFKCDNVYIEKLQDLITREYQLQLFIIEEGTLHSSQAKVQRLSEITSNLVEMAQNDPERVCLNSISQLKYSLAKQINEASKKHKETLRAKTRYLTRLEGLGAPTHEPLHEIESIANRLPVPSFNTVDYSEELSNHFLTSFRIHTLSIPVKQLSDQEVENELFPDLLHLKNDVSHYNYH